MINQGFVTDSDTEKELKKWQQARTTAVDEDKLKQQYKNRLNNAQGQHFEREILAGCRMYESHGIATIDKTPEPFRVTSKNHRTGEFTGRFSTHAQPDFQGTLYGGRSIMFEAKRTSKDRITRNVLTDTQMDVLEKTYDKLTFDFEGLLGSDMIAVENEMAAVGEYVLSPEISTSFLSKMAARAAGVGSDLIEHLPIRDFGKIKNKSRDFLVTTGLTD